MAAWQSLVLIAGAVFAVYGVVAFLTDIWSDHVKEKAPTINQNDFAVEAARREGGKHNLSIAQVKEVVRITFDMLAEHPWDAVEKMLRRRRKG